MKTKSKRKNGTGDRPPGSRPAWISKSYPKCIYNNANSEVGAESYDVRKFVDSVAHGKKFIKNNPLLQMR